MTSRRHGKREWTGIALAAIASLLLLRADPAQGAPVMAPIAGEIERISLDDPADVWSGGRIVAGGQSVVIPRNLLIDLPANRLTLQQLFAQAPPACLANGETGLAKADRCNIDATGGLATLFSNRTNGGDVIAGDVRISKAVESVTGVVTFINYADGYFRLNGIPGDNATGVMVRVNDPSGRHTIQQGSGCAPGNAENCSADARFAIDSTNYTFAFATGYPPCIPSIVNGANGSTGAGDPFCPSTNRPGHPSPDSTRFAPIILGDSLSATGNFERVGGVQFLSAHTVKVFADVTTQNLPTQPDYMIFNEVDWDAPPYPGSRVGARFLGATSLHDSRVDIFSVHYDTANVPHEVPLETTANNANNGPVLFAGLPIGVFSVVLDVDFLEPVIGLEPCPDLIRGDIPGISAFCSNPSTLAQNFRLMSPIAREVVGRTRHKATLSPGVVTRDIRGNLAPNGQYLTPVGVEYPGMEGIDLGRLRTPFSFSGVPWNLDRRLSPGGCIGPCEGTPQPLSPFPFEGIDPRTQSLRAPVPDPSRILSFYPFGASNVLAWPPADPAPIGVTPVEPLVLACNLLLSSVTSSPLPAGPQSPGTSVTWTAVASGGSGSYQYQFWLHDGTSWSIAKPYGATNDNTWTWNTGGLAAGTYRVQVWARNAGSTAAYEAFTPVATYVLAVVLPPATSVSLTPPPSPASPQFPGASVLWTAVAGGGSGSYQYQFWLHDGTSWSIAKAYGATNDNAWTWNTGGLAAGTYRVQVWARSAGSTAAYEAFTPVTTYVLTSVTLTLPPSPPSPQSPGTSVLWTAVAGGGSGSYQYQFWLHDGTSWSVAKPYGATNDNTWTWNTGGLAAGTYRVQVWARNAGSTASYEAFTPVATYVLSATPPATGVTLAPPPSPAGPQAPGVSVLWTAVAGGGSGNYQYQFWLHDGTSWSVAKPYGATDDNTWTWNTGGLATGTYRVQVWARSAGSPALYEAFTPVATYVLQ